MLRHCGKLFALKLLSPEEAAENRSTLLQKLRDEEEQAKEVEDSAWESPLKEPEFQRVEENQLVGAEELCFPSTKQGMGEREVGGDLGTESIEADTANTLVDTPVTNTLRAIASKQAESRHPIRRRTPLKTAELDMKMFEWDGDSEVDSTPKAVVGSSKTIPGSYRIIQFTAKNPELKMPNLGNSNRIVKKSSPRMVNRIWSLSVIRVILTLGLDFRVPKDGVRAEKPAKKLWN
ncbi:unnamed protein product [Linum trigynum]|uniref:Uncharacterized protein n=1 Tax=Linum trigynum TaxID=586398 RepID=A0AAV2D9T9_9ROSI